MQSKTWIKPSHERDQSFQTKQNKIIQRHQTLQLHDHHKPHKPNNTPQQIPIIAQPKQLQQNNNATHTNQIQTTQYKQHTHLQPKNNKRTTTQTKHEHNVPAIHALPTHEHIKQHNLQPPQPKTNQNNTNPPNQKNTNDRAPNQLHQAPPKPTIK